MSTPDPLLTAVVQAYEDLHAYSDWLTAERDWRYAQHQSDLAEVVKWYSRHCARIDRVRACVEPLIGSPEPYVSSTAQKIVTILEGNA